MTRGEGISEIRYCLSKEIGPSCLEKGTQIVKEGHRGKVVLGGS